MRFLARFLGIVPRAERDGIRLDTTAPYWELTGDTDFPTLLRCLDGLLPDGCILYCEGGSPDAVLAAFLLEHGVPEQEHVARGTIWPRPRVFHLPATRAVLGGLADAMARHAWPELAIHVHVYRGRTVLLEWHDAFSQPLLLSGEFAEQQVSAFCACARLRYLRAGPSRPPVTY